MNCLTAVLSWRVLYSDNTGTKACEKAPSANNRRRKLGILKATKNASAAAPSPNIAAKTVSLQRPRIRENNVAPEVTIEDLNKPAPFAESGLSGEDESGVTCIGISCSYESAACYRYKPVLSSFIMSNRPPLLTIPPQNSIVRVFFRVARSAARNAKPDHKSIFTYSRSFPWQTLHRPANAPNKLKNAVATTPAFVPWCVLISRK